jgi:hypothetical protein
MKTLALSAALIIAGAFTPASAQVLPPVRAPYPPVFYKTLSNNTPLTFGMNEEEAARALGTPLAYVRGRRGDEIYLTFRDLGGSGLIPHRDRLYLQFRKGRLTGWKADWGQNWMWH